MAFCISGTQENERAQHGAWQVLEVHRMSVLSSVPEIRSSGGWGGIRMEVPAQRSTLRCCGSPGGWKNRSCQGKVANVTFLEPLLEQGTEKSVGRTRWVRVLGWLPLRLDDGKGAK